jgi:hypothetical protein
VTGMVCHKTDRGCEVSGFCTGADEVLVLLGGGTMIVVARFQAFALVHFRFGIFWEVVRHWLIGDIRLEMLDTNHPVMWRHIPEEWRPHLLLGVEG